MDDIKEFLDDVKKYLDDTQVYLMEMIDGNSECDVCGEIFSNDLLARDDLNIEGERVRVNICRGCYDVTYNFYGESGSRLRDFDRETKLSDMAMFAFITYRPQERKVSE